MDKKTLGKVEITQSNGLGTISFMHPAGNSLPRRLLNELVQSITKFGQDDTIKAILLKSEGDRAFCGGASFDEFMAIENEEQGQSFFMGFAQVIDAMRTCPKFIIVRLQGKAVGGGVGIAAAADYCMASKYASIKLSELTIGIGPFVIGPAVERKIGTSAFGHLAINANEWQTAEWAKAKGLFNEVFETTKQLDEYLIHFISQLQNYNPAAMTAIKQMLWQGTDNWDELLRQRAIISGKLVTSSYTKAAIERFKQKS